MTEEVHLIKPTLRDGYRTLLGTAGSKRVFVLAFLLVLLGYFAISNGESAFSLLSFHSLSVADKIPLFFAVFFDITTLVAPALLVLVLLTAFFGGLVLAQFFAYFKLRKEILATDGAYMGIGLILATLGVGCAACGTLVVSTVFGLLGYSSLLAAFPFQGLEIGYVGVFSLILLSYSLMKKLSSPLIC